MARVDAGTHGPGMIRLDIIDNLTDDWTVNDFAGFLHYRFQNGDREPRRYWYQYGSLLAKLVHRGWAGESDDEVVLTPDGAMFREALLVLEDSPDIADANLNLRRHRLLDWHDHALDSEALLRLASGRSGKVRVEAARALMDEENSGDRSLADRLASSNDPEVRAIVAPYADPHLFLGELNPEVIRVVVRGGRVDDVCRRRWTSPDEPFEIRLAAGALVTDGKEADRMLATMAGYERIRFLCEYPRLAVGKRAANACRTAGDDGAPLEYSMTRVPDDYLREALESKSYHWGLKSRVEDYRQALREAMRLERLFAGPDSQVLAEIREQVEAEIAKEEER